MASAMEWFHRLASPRWFYNITGTLLPWVISLSVILLLTGSVWGLAYAPVDYQQGNSYRIMFVHVPSVILAQSSYMMMAVAGAIFLVWKIKLADAAMATCAPIGASVTLAGLLTGAIWGKPTWGTWWEWDARMTSTLVLLFLFMGMMALRSAMEKSESAGKACAILAIVGVINIPIIKYSVEWWNSLHQTSSFTLTEKPAMPPEMWIPLLVMVIGFYLFFFSVWMLRMRGEILFREFRADWVKKEVLDAV